MDDVEFLDHEPAEGCLSDLTLDRLIAGELDDLPDKTAALEHMDSCDRCTARHSELAAHVEGIADALWLQGMAAEARKRACETESNRSITRSRWRPLAAVVAVAAGIALVVVGLGDRGDGPGDIRTKGDGVITLVAQHPDGRQEEVLPGGELSPGDTIAFVLSSHRPGYVTVIGLDSAQVVSVYFPVAKKPVWLEAGRGQVLDGAVTLDDTLGSERIVAVICKSPISAAAAREAGVRALARAGGSPREVAGLALEGCSETTTAIRKVARQP